MNQPDLPLTNRALFGNLYWLRKALRYALVYGSAVLIAVVISGGIFSFTPLIGVSVAHTKGVSMEPLHKAGDVVLVRKIDGAQANVGDVVVFKDSGLNIMHRVVRRYTSDSGALMLLTQGDNVPVPDHPILASEVTGRLMTKIPLLGDISRLIDGKGGFHVYQSIIISVAVSWVAIWGIFTSAKSRRSPDESGDS